MDCKCFKCEKSIESAVFPNIPKNQWSMPCGVLFDGGYNFGSELYDALLDGLKVQIIVCDDCIRKNRHLINEVQTDEGYTKRNK